MADDAYRVVHRHSTVNHWLAPRSERRLEQQAWRVALSARADSGCSCAVV